MSLMYGFSIISYIEIVYFATGKFFVLYMENLKLKLERKLSTLTMLSEKVAAEELEDDDPPPAYNLCWKELMPKPPVDVDIFRNDGVLKLYNKEEM